LNLFVSFVTNHGFMNTEMLLIATEFTRIFHERNTVCIDSPVLPPKCLVFLQNYIFWLVGCFYLITMPSWDTSRSI